MTTKSNHNLSDHEYDGGIWYGMECPETILTPMSEMGARMLDCHHWQPLPWEFVKRCLAHNQVQPRALQHATHTINMCGLYLPSVRGGRVCMSTERRKEGRQEEEEEDDKHAHTHTQVALPFSPFSPSFSGTNHMSYVP